MTPSDFSPADLTLDWHEVQPEEAEALAVELDNEVRPGHRLYGVAADPVAAHRRRKEVLFWLPEEHRWACVHLTWTEETDARWPTVEVAEDWPSALAYLKEADRA